MRGWEGYSRLSLREILRFHFVIMEEFFSFCKKWWPTLCNIRIYCLLKTTKMDPLVVFWWFNNSNNNREEWVHPINASRKEFGVMTTLYPQLRNDEVKFFNYVRMTTDTYDLLLLAVQPKVMGQFSKFREPIDVNTKLFLTLR